MKKEITVITLIVVLFALCSSAEAQQTKTVRRIGFLSSVSSKTAAHLWGAFLEGLQNAGYVEGRNIVIEQRWAEGRTDRLPELAAELIRLKVEIIVSTGGTVTAFAAKNATSSIPIVFTVGGDLVKLGLVANLARPGGNLTGLSLLSTELNVKRLELLQEAFPEIRLMRVLGNPANPNYAIQLTETQAAGKALGLQVEMLEMRNSSDIDVVFAAMSNKDLHAILVLSDPMLNANRKRIADAVTKRRVPAIYEFKEFVEAGGLMSYGTDILAVYRRISVYVDKIFKGANPAGLPVEQPTKFELVINLKAAKQIGLTIPPNVLARADRVIR